MTQKKVAVVGGGISGLTAAFRLQKQLPNAQIELFESDSQTGGVLRTHQHQDWLIESSADMFASDPSFAVDLCNEIGLEQLCSTNPVGRRAYVVRNRQLVPVPAGLSLMQPRQLKSVLQTPILSFSGRLRMLAERNVPRRHSEQDESVFSFATRRLGLEAYQRLIQPLVGGIYSADAKRLSMQATMQRFVEMEREFGSLILAAKSSSTTSSTGSIEQESSGARYGMFLAPQDGMASMVVRLTAELNRVTLHRNRPVTSLTRDETGWQITIQDSDKEQTTNRFDAVILATSAKVSSHLLGHTCDTLSHLLSQLTYASMAIVILAVDQSQLTAAPHCFGFVIPEIESMSMIACSFASNKFPGRAPAEKPFCDALSVVPREATWSVVTIRS